MPRASSAPHRHRSRTTRRKPTASSCAGPDGDITCLWRQARPATAFPPRQQRSDHFQRRKPLGKKSRSPKLMALILAGLMSLFLRRLLRMIAPYRGRFIAGILSGVAFGVANAALMLAVKLVVDVIFPTASVPTVQEQLHKAPAFVRHLAGQLGQ